MAKGKKTGGRKKGTPNKVTASMRECFAEAFEQLGGTKALVDWGRDNQTDFYKLAARLIPVEITGKDGGAAQLVMHIHTDKTDK